MPVMCLYRALKVTPEAYDAVRAAVDWEGDVPPGAIGHFIAFRDGEAVEADIWESQAAYQLYRDSRLNPVLDRMGLVIDEPEILDLHVAAIGAPAAQAYVVPRAITPACAPA